MNINPHIKYSRSILAALAEIFSVFTTVLFYSIFLHVTVTLVRRLAYELISIYFSSQSTLQLNFGRLAKQIDNNLFTSAEEFWEWSNLHNFNPLNPHKTSYSSYSLAEFTFLRYLTQPHSKICMSGVNSVYWVLKSVIESHFSLR